MRRLIDIAVFSIIGGIIVMTCWAAMNKTVKGIYNVPTLTTETYKVGYKKGNNSWVEIEELGFIVPEGRVITGAQLEFTGTERDE